MIWHKLGFCLLPLMVSATAIGGTVFKNTDQYRFEKTNSCTKCDLTDITFDQSTPHNSAILENSNMMYCNFQYSAFSNANFVGAYLIRSNAISARFRQSNFSSANINNAYLVLSEFSGAKFVNAILTNTNFTQSNLSGVDFTGANLKGVDFTRAILIGATISDEQLSKVKSLRCAVMPNGSVNAPKDDPRCTGASSVSKS